MHGVTRARARRCLPGGIQRIRGHYRLRGSQRSRPVVVPTHWRAAVGFERTGDGVSLPVDPAQPRHRGGWRDQTAARRIERPHRNPDRRWRSASFDLSVGCSSGPQARS